MGFSVAVSIPGFFSWRAVKTLPRGLIRNRVNNICLFVKNAEQDGVRVRKLVTGIRRAVRVNASAKGRDHGWSQMPLDDVCRRLHLCFFEVI